MLEPWNAAHRHSAAGLTIHPEEENMCTGQSESEKLEQELEPRPSAIDKVVAVVKEFFSWDNTGRHEEFHEHTQD